MSLQDEMNQLGRNARIAAQALAQAIPEHKTAALLAAAKSLRAQAKEILAANAKDVAAATHLSSAMIDRLKLDEKRIEGMAKGIEIVAQLPDPVGRVLEKWDVDNNGLHIEKVAVPLGVIGMIYESRPNVTADATALAFKAGNAVILRGGTDSFHSSHAILAAMKEGFRSVGGLPEAAAQIVATPDREAVSMMLTMNDFIDVIIPRGGKSLTERVRREARVPTLLHLDGNCHMYIHAKAGAAKALGLVVNAKLRRTGICGALETLLIDQAVLQTMAPAIIAALLDKGCELRGDERIKALDNRIKAATEEDWTTEYLEAILAVKVVNGLQEAVDHINHYGSHHTDAIVTEDAAAAEIFTRAVDSAIVTVNTSTQFADGGEFGFGSEIGIATGRLHARGPVGAAQLTTHKYILTTARADGALRAG